MYSNSIEVVVHFQPVVKNGRNYFLIFAKQIWYLIGSTKKKVLSLTKVLSLGQEIKLLCEIQNVWLNVTQNGGCNTVCDI